MKQFAVALLILVFSIVSLCLLASCDEPPVVVPKTTAIKHFTVLVPASDLEPSNGVNKVYFSLIKDFSGDTIAIYQSMSGGVQVINTTQQHLANPATDSK